MTTRKPDPRPARTRRSVLDAARELIDEHGIEQTTIGDLSKRSKVAVGSIYTHFGSKENVILELVDHDVAEAVVHLAATQTTGTAIERIHAVGEAILRYAVAHPAEALAWIGGRLLPDEPTPASERLAHRVTAVVAGLEDDLRTAMDDGTLPAGDPERTAFLLLSTWTGAASAAARTDAARITGDAARWVLDQADALVAVGAGAPGEIQVWANRF